MKTVEENNRLIAEFMGAEVYEAPNFHGKIIWWAKYPFDNTPMIDERVRNLLNLEYATSWDWLMPVVEKIEHSSIGEYISFSVNVINQSCCIYCHFKNAQDGVIYQTPWGQAPDTKIEAVYSAVIEFINWYNQQQP